MFGIQHVTPQALLVVALISFVAVVVGYYIRKLLVELKTKESTGIAQSLIQEAEKKAENIKSRSSLDAREKFFKMRSEVEKEIKNKKNEQKNIERRIVAKEESVTKKLEVLESKDKDLQNRLKEVTLTLEKVNKNYVQSGDCSYCFNLQAIFLCLD